MKKLCLLVVLVAAMVSFAMAADVTAPAEVAGLHVDKSAPDVRVSWAAVTADASGTAEAVDHYNVYRGTTPDFVPDRSGGSNRIGTSLTLEFLDAGVLADGLDAYYRVSAVDASGNEGGTMIPTVMAPPVLSGFWTDTTIELDWTDATPADQVSSYRVYYGKTSAAYEFVDDVGLAKVHSLSGLELFVNWYISVRAVDQNGNESEFSNEHIDSIAGRVKVRAHNDEELCWGAAKCTPTDPMKIQRSDGWQLLVPTNFPEGDWKRVLVTYTIDSKLWNPPAGGNVSKCGTGNPCVNPPCNGGYNTHGDPWDRTAHLFLVLDDCINAGGSCITDDNLELIRAVTPFGSDAPLPEGTGIVPPRVLTFDVTPFANLLNGEMYVGAEIGHFVQTGWHVTVDFEFSERADEASAKPPAAGVKTVVFRGGGEVLTPRTVDIPATATSVMGRFFITGHGGNQACDGGSANGQSCDTGCPGGSCQNCDEFCHREHMIKVDGSTAWQVTPWRDDCSPGSITDCISWNACGWPSCTFSRAGWCPGYIACHSSGACDQDQDLTGWMTPGLTHDVTWEIPIRNGSWSKSMVVYWYE